MNKASRAGYEILTIEALTEADSPVHRLDPLAKLLITVAYIAVVVSFNKYDLTGIFVMILFPLAGYMISITPLGTAFYRMRIVIPLVCAVGIANPFLDREILVRLGSIGVSGGVISMITLMLKGVFSLLASFLLIATTSIYDICRGLRRIHFPKILTSLIMLTFRYITVLLGEVSIMTDAYALRAPGQRGVHISAWGSFLGQLILRSMDRASALYDSMTLRGFDGEFYSARGNAAAAGRKMPVTTELLVSWLPAIVIVGLVLLARIFNVAQLVGQIFTNV